MKRFVSIILILTLCMSLGVNASSIGNIDAGEMENIIDEPISSEMDDLSEEEIYAQMVKQLPGDENLLISEGLLLQENRAVIKGESAVQGTASTNGTTGNVYGPYTSAKLPPAAAFAMVNALADKDYSVTTYKGVSCYQFEYGADTVYVAVSVFHQEDAYGQFPTNASISSNVTSYLHNENSDDYYAMKYQIFIADAIPYANFTVFGMSAFDYNGELAIKTKIVASVTTYSSFTIVREEVSPGLYVSPSISAQITNVGPEKAYMGGFYVKGLGKNNSEPDLSELLVLGVKATMEAASVSGLSYGTFLDLAAGTISFGKNDDGLYLSDTVPLSNVSKNRYAYSAELQATFDMTKIGHYYQMHIDIVGGVDGPTYDIDIEL